MLPLYMEILFLAKTVFGDALKSRLPRVHILAFSPKTEAHFWHFQALVVSLERKGGIS